MTASLYHRRTDVVLEDYIERISGRVLDWYLGIETRGYFEPRQLGNADPDAQGYTPTSYGRAWKLLRMAQFVPQQDAFLEYGCGLGRVLVLASRYPYAQVIGVESSADLCRRAQRNLEAARARQRCGSVAVVHTDATEFQVPDNATVLYFYNPFRGDTMRKVSRRIAESLQRRPRPIQLLVCNCADFLEVTDSANWLMRSYFSQSGSHSLCVFRSKV
jgi:SAM-dependent methyltransferase